MPASDSTALLAEALSVAESAYGVDNLLRRLVRCIEGMQSENAALVARVRAEAEAHEVTRKRLRDTLSESGELQAAAHRAGQEEGAAEMRSALEPFALFADKFAAKPVGSLSNRPLPDDHPIYAIHCGTEWEAQITLGHLRAAARAPAAPAPREEPDSARSLLISLFRAFETGRIPEHLPGCPDVLGYDDMADWFLGSLTADLARATEERDAIEARIRSEWDAGAALMIRQHEAQLATARADAVREAVKRIVVTDRWGDRWVQIPTGLSPHHFAVVTEDELLAALAPSPTPTEGEAARLRAREGEHEPG